MTQRFPGLTAAAYTPLHADGSIAPERAAAIVDHLVADGCTGVLIHGSTGEGPSLTMAEREEMAAAFVEAARGRLRTMVHVGHLSGAEARRLAAHAVDIGADAVLAQPPMYFRPKDVGMLADWLAHLAEAAGDLPFYYYHIPVITGVALPMHELLAAAEDHGLRLAGMKFTYEDLADLRLCLESGDCEMLFGRDEILLAALALGVGGAIGSTYNYAAPLYRRMWQAFEAGDLATARTCQSRSIAMIEALRRAGGGVPPGKALMKLIGLDLGPCRSPLRLPDDDTVGRLERELRDIGFFDWGRA